MSQSQHGDDPRTFHMYNEADGFDPLRPGLFDAIRQSLGWETNGNQLGKTVFQPAEVDEAENSVFIATKGLCDPHGYSEDYANFVVEAIGPDVTDASDVEYNFFDDHEEALAQVATHMARIERPE